MNSFLKDKDFTLLWLANFFSTVSGFILLLSISIHIYETSASALNASMVFASQWFLGAFLAPLVNRIISSKTLLTTILLAEVVGIVVTGLIAVMITEGFTVTIILLALRGLIDAVAKSTRVLMSKIFIEKENFEKKISFFGTSQYTGASVGSLISVGLISSLGVEYIVLIAAMFCSISVLFYQFLDKSKNTIVSEKNQSGYYRKTVGILTSNKKIFWNVGILFLSVIICQSLHNVLRIPLPEVHYEMGKGGIFILQILSTTAIISGAVIVTFFFTEGSVLNKRSAGFYMFLSIVGVFAALFNYLPSLGFIAYFFFLFFFEICYTKAQRDLVIFCSASELQYLSTFLFSTQMTFMSLSIIIGGLIADREGIPFTVISFGVFYLFYILILKFFEANYVVLYEKKETV